MSASWDLSADISFWKFKAERIRTSKEYVSDSPLKRTLSEERGNYTYLDYVMLRRMLGRK
jgi:hypothetical protein